MEKTYDRYYSSRIATLRQYIKRKKLDGFLVTNLTNVRYLTGFTGSSGFVFITAEENIFNTDFRYKEQAEKEINGWDIVIARGTIIKSIRKIARKTGVKKLGVESSVSYGFFNKLSRNDLKLKAFEGTIEKLREIKDAIELNCIKEAINRAESALLEVKPFIKRGNSEQEISLRLEERLRRNGCRRIPFDIIVASGHNASMPHAKPTEKKLNPGDLIIVDWGGEAGGYFSDITRTFLIKGKNTSRQKEIYGIVLQANANSISHIRANASSKDIDFYARDVIKKKGYGKFFGHGTGHGVGLNIHEEPRITWNQKKILKEGMVFTIEPGIYLSGVGGVRIEDMIVVREKGAEVLTTLPRTLEIL